MRQFLSIGGLILLLVGSVSAWAVNALSVGDVAPEFTATVSLDGQDAPFSLADAYDKGPVVVYFFPSAYTQGCDIEAHTFATHMTAFRQQHTTVIGVSADSLTRLHEFSKDPDFCAGEFPLVSDPEGHIASRYGVAIGAAREGLSDVRGDAVAHDLFERATYVLDRGGKVVAVFSSEKDGLSPVDHVLESLDVVTQLNRGH